MDSRQSYDQPGKIYQSASPVSSLVVPHRSSSRWLTDAIALGFILLVALVYLSPAFKDGLSFGPARLGSQLSVLAIPHNNSTPSNDVLNSDVISQGVAWNTLDWELIHHGELPLWNDQSGTGLPQLLNFESAPLALPTLIGYLMPLALSFTVTILIKLLIAGTGTYVVVRLLRGRPLAATFAGVTAMLSGSFAGWLGWPISGPLSWSGWIIASIILVYRAPPGKRGRYSLLLALVTMFCIFGGFPETYVLMAGGLMVLLVATGLAMQATHKSIDWRAVVRLALGFGAGLILSSPLWLPGLQIITGSIRSNENMATGLPFHLLTLLVVQGYYGLPLATTKFPHGTFFGPFDYFETAAYVGVIALVLAGTCVARTWRRPVVVGFLACAVGTALTVYDLGGGAPVQHLITDLGLGTVALQRMLPVLGFAIAILAGLGLEMLLRRWREPLTQRLFLSVVIVMGAIIALLWIHARMPNASLAAAAGLTPGQMEALRERSLYWPTGEMIVLVVVALSLPILARRWNNRHQLANARIRALMGGILGLQTLFLIIAGVGINSYASTSYPLTPALTALRQTVGTQLFGIDGSSTPCTGAPNQVCGLRSWNGIGIYPEMNLGYGLTEFAMHDPIIPRAYFEDFPVHHDDRLGGGTNIFAPNITSIALAQLYGIHYVIVAPPNPIPPGMHLKRVIIAEGVHLEVVSVPNSHRFSVVDAPPTSAASKKQGGSSSPRTVDRVIGVAHPSDTSYTLRLNTPNPAKLTIRITDVPGWHVSANGHSLPLHHAPGDLMSANLPAGTKRVSLSYQPTLLTVGESLAAISLAALLVCGIYVDQKDRDHGRSGPRIDPRS